MEQVSKSDEHTLATAAAAAVLAAVSWKSRAVESLERTIDRFKRVQAVRSHNASTICRAKELIASSKRLQRAAQCRACQDYETSLSLLLETSTYWESLSHRSEPPLPALESNVLWLDRATSAHTESALLEQAKNWVPPIDDTEEHAPGGSTGFFELIGL